jgi:hypothetical protein
LAFFKFLREKAMRRALALTATIITTFFAPTAHSDTPDSRIADQNPDTNIVVTPDDPYFRWDKKLDNPPPSVVVPNLVGGICEDTPPPPYDREYDYVLGTQPLWFLNGKLNGVIIVPKNPKNYWAETTISGLVLVNRDTVPPGNQRDFLNDPPGSKDNDPFAKAEVLFHVLQPTQITTTSTGHSDKFGPYQNVSISVRFLEDQEDREAALGQSQESFLAAMSVAMQMEKQKPTDERTIITKFDPKFGTIGLDFLDGFETKVLATPKMQHLLTQQPRPVVLTDIEFNGRTTVTAKMRPVYTPTASFFAYGSNALAAGVLTPNLDMARVSVSFEPEGALANGWGIPGGASRLPIKFIKQNWGDLPGFSKFLDPWLAKIREKNSGRQAGG